mmetsp:Transcript_29909/g.68961  ORF Transcript_29909/g.68961 Transcript_29909/m.68961 type:complete len:575 (-) Transcript_29909:84-1808(-)
MAPTPDISTTLKAGLLRQFGPAAKVAIEYEVESRVAASAGKLRREDLDEIERSVLAALKQKRKTAVKGSKVETTDLTAVKALSSSQALTRPQSRSSMPGPKPHTASSTKRQKAAGGRSLANSDKRATSAPLLMPVSGGPYTLKKAAPVPPFGLSLTRDDDSELRPSSVNPRYEVPLAPKLKPVDHWDLIVAFDTDLFKKEEAERYRFNKSSGFKMRKSDLDKQVEEKRVLKEHEAEVLRLEREEHRAQVLEDAKLKEQEEHALWAKREAQRKNNEAMAQELGAKRERDAQKKRRECMEINAWLQAEKDRKAEEQRLQRIEYAKKCDIAQEAFSVARAERRQRKLDEQEREMQAVEEAKRFLDAAEAKNRAAVAKRESRVAAIAESLGASVAQRDADEERKLNEKIQRVLEEQDRKNREDSRMRQERKDRLTREMLNSLDQQIADRDKHKIEEKEADRIQLEIFRKQLEEQNEKRRKEALQAQKNRGDLDLTLIEQMRRNASVHPRQFGLTADIQRQELAFNRLIYEHMAAENFCPEMTQPMLDAAHDRGRLTNFPSVGPYHEPIHSLDLQVPDV